MKYTKYLVTIVLINFVFISCLVLTTSKIDIVLNNTGFLGTKVNVNLQKFKNQVSSNNNEPCLIIIDGNTYDVTALRSSHDGGDVFNCGTDMTKIFYSEHDKTLKENELSGNLVK